MKIFDANLFDNPTDVGSRVMIPLPGIRGIAGGVELATVTRKRSGHSYVVRTINNKIETVRFDEVVPVEIFYAPAKSFKRKQLEQYITRKMPLDIFTQNLPVRRFDIQLLEGMWYWTDHNIFGRRMSRPQLSIVDDRSAAGWYNVDANAILISRDRNRTARNIFSTMLHETIHQFNYQIDRVNTKDITDPRERSRVIHGEYFMRWVGVIKRKTGVSIDVPEVQREGPVIHKKEARRFMLVLTKINQGKEPDHFATWSPSQKDLVELRTRLRKSQPLSDRTIRTSIFELSAQAYMLVRDHKIVPEYDPTKLPDAITGFRASATSMNPWYLSDDMYTLLIKKSRELEKG